jgi:thioredoxin reductase
MRTDSGSTNFDVIVIGGSYAGMSAAMQLARARREVLVIDAGMRRNRFAKASHGFLGQDGRAPDSIAAEGRAQLLAYPNVHWLEGTATQAGKSGDGFTVTVNAGESFRAKRLVLATGVVDELPAVEGLAERWGRSVFHCPYCHGYELNKGRIGVLAQGALSLHHAMLLPDWGEVTLFINDTFDPDEKQSAELSARGVAIERERVVRITETATIELGDGRRVALDGLFTLSSTRMASAAAGQLGCAFDKGPLGPFIHTDALKATTVPGVFACGDAARAAGSVAMAVGDGAQAGVAAHQSMIFG